MLSDASGWPFSPIVGVVGPGARAAAARTTSGRIGVIGTYGTIESGAYRDHLLAIDPGFEVVSRPCPLFVPLAEEGWTDHPVARQVAAEYLAPFREGIEAGTPIGDLLIDEVVESDEEMDGAIAARVAALTDSGLVNAAGNRRALRVGAEPLDLFRQYMSVFCREQAYCHLSPALVRNLERHWSAHERSL